MVEDRFQAEVDTEITRTWQEAQRSRHEEDAHRDGMRVMFDGDAGSFESVSMAITSAVGDAVETPPSELEPLYSAVDAEALDAVARSGGFQCITFTYHGCEVQVHKDGRIGVSTANG